MLVASDPRTDRRAPHSNVLELACDHRSRHLEHREISMTSVPVFPVGFPTLTACSASTTPVDPILVQGSTGTWVSCDFGAGYSNCSVTGSCADSVGNKVDGISGSHRERILHADVYASDDSIPENVTSRK